VVLPALTCLLPRIAWLTGAAAVGVCRAVEQRDDG
jgi:hypothetical protein